MTRKIFNIMGGLIILFVIVYTLYPFIVGRSEMETFCSSIRIGEAKTELINRAQTAHYLTKESNLNGADRLLVINSRAMGRYICEVTLEENRVATAKYVSND